VESWYQTLFPGIAFVCGRTLKPLTLWRQACLEAINSPFLAADGDCTVTPKDLVVALRCVDTETLDPPDLEPTRGCIKWLNALSASADTWHTHATAFVTYLQRHNTRPALWQRENDDGRMLTAPHSLTQVVALMKLGMSHKEAWSTSPGYATWLILAAAERETDRVRFERDDDTVIIHKEDMTDAEEVETARQNLPRDMFERWLEARKGGGNG
jgi:hypothetical protein